MKKIILSAAALLLFYTVALAQDLTPETMLRTINKEGKVALYINFETSKSEINAESMGVIDLIAQMMNTDKKLRIRVEGHTDNAGNPKTNQTLSENRARAVMEGIIAKGVDGSRLSSKGWGSKKPLADNNTEDAKARNRRVEIVKVK